MITETEPSERPLNPWDLKDPRQVTYQDFAEWFPGEDEDQSSILFASYWKERHHRESPNTSFEDYLDSLFPLVPLATEHLTL